MLWNGWQLDPERHDVDAVDALFERVNAGLARPMSSDVEHREAAGSAWTDGVVVVGPGAELLRESRREVAEWTWEMPTPTYLELLGTTSQYRVAEPRVRAELAQQPRRLHHRRGLFGQRGKALFLDFSTGTVEREARNPQRATANRCSVR